MKFKTMFSKSVIRNCNRVQYILPLPVLTVDGDKLSAEPTHLVEEAKRPRSETASIDAVPEMILSSIHKYTTTKFRTIGVSRVTVV